MRLVVDGNEACQLQMGVALGGAQTLVTEEFLDVAQVRAGLEQVAGEAVPQHVWGDVLGDSGLRGQLSDDAVGLAALQASPSGTKKQGLLVCLWLQKEAELEIGGQGQSCGLA